MLTRENLVILATITSKISTIGPSKPLPLFRICYLVILSILARSPSAQAQVTPDGTLSTRVTSSDNQNFIIEDGDRSGNNLFHSFSDFSVPTNGSAVFNNATTIENIFGRVTGNNISAIDGLIQANGMANVFLLNPNGIVFGENASLDVGGSFTATTAERILFGDATEFSTVDATSVPLLTVSAPVGLGLGANPESITITGPGHNLELNRGTAVLTQDNRPVGLQVNTGKTLALIGGDILVEGGNLTANQGRVELGSVAQAGTVALSPTTDGFTADYSTIDRFGNLSFTDAASVDISGEGSGNLYFQSGNLSVLDGSAIISNVIGADDGGKVQVRASDTVEIRSSSQTDAFPSSFFNYGEQNSTGQLGEMVFDVGTLGISGDSQVISIAFGEGNGSSVAVQANQVSLTGGAQFTALTVGQGDAASIAIQANQIALSGVSPSELVPTYISATALPGSEGNAGSIDLQTDTLRVTGGAQILNATFGQGDAASIAIQANQIELSGVSPSGRIPTGISTSAQSGSQGNSGNIDLQADTLRVTGGAQILNGTFGQGDAANLAIRARQIELSGFSSSGFNSGLFAGAYASPGNAGSMNLQVDTLQVTDGAVISTGTFGPGRGGSLTIQANQIALRGSQVVDLGEGDSFGVPSGIFASTEAADGGNAGDIDIQVNTLQIAEGAQIASRTRGRGNGGTIVIRANDLQLNGIEPSRRSPSVISTSTDAADGGNAGNIDLQVDRLQVTAGAQIDSRTRGQGDGGTVVIQANDLQVSGIEPEPFGAFGEFSPGISTSSAVGGNAGSIEIQVEKLRVTDEASISVSSLGEGNASDLNITADQILLTDGGTLEAEVAAGDQGNIFLTTEDLLLMRRGALVSTNATNQATGGNITIESPVILGLEDSDIIANAEQGDGGRINITTQGLLGLQFRDFQTTESDITASSDFGQSGTVDIDLPDTEPNADIVELPANLEDASARIGQSLCAGEGNAFTASGRGGLPTSPYDSLNGQITWEDWYIAESPDDFAAADSVVVESDRATAPQDSTSATDVSVALVEAQDWGVNPQGDVVFTAAVESGAGVQLSDGSSCRRGRQALK